MTKLIWGAPGNRSYTTGVDRGVLYPKNSPAAAWSGLVSVVEAPSDVVIDTIYNDGMKDQNSKGESFTARVNAMTYPANLLEYEVISFQEGRETRRSEVGLSYRTLIGTDTEGLDHGYKIHLVYNALLSPTEKAYSTIDQDAAAEIFGWDLQTRPIPIEGFRPSAHVVLNTALSYPWAVSALEDVLYGTATTSPRLPTPAEVIEIFQDAAIVKITDHGDGTWTADGPDYAVYMTDDTSFEISWPSAVFIDSQSYTVSTL